MIYNQRLIQLIKDDIHVHDGWISFAEFMQKALYEPGLGYYVAGARKLGEEGDFVTAPEISSAFSQCLARYCQRHFQAGDSILEFGAGTGVMAADILLELERLSSLPKQYFILEVSPDLHQRQHETLEKKCPHLVERVVWLQALPQDFEGVVLANEVLDAMPVHVFEIQEGQVFERGVSVNNEGFLWKTNIVTPAEAGAQSSLREISKRLDASLRWHDSSERNVNSKTSFIEGYFSEFCPAIKPWLEDLYTTMKRGVVLIIDYGFLEHEYYHPQRDQGTLMCHYRHRAHTDPFINVGLQDITAHVDFSFVARAAEEAGFKVENYTTQAKFLMSLGILEAGNLPLVEQYQHAQALKKLLLPSEMGELFKVITLSKSKNPNKKT